MTVQELAKMKLIYQYLFMTENPNNISQEVRKKLKKKLRHIMTYQETLYNEATALQERVYKEAWHNLFDGQEATYISLGLFMTKLYNSIEKQKLVGHQRMKDMFDSYYLCPSSHGLTDEEERTMSNNAENLATEVIRLIDGEVAESPLRRRALTIKNNLIIEGKIK